VIDSDVPWIPLVNRPTPTARIIHIDIDPLKQQIPLWYIGAQHTFFAEAGVALRQLNECIERSPIDARLVSERYAYYELRHRQRQIELQRREQSNGAVITPEYLTACVARAVGPDAVVLSEAVTNYRVVAEHSGRTKPVAAARSDGMEVQRLEPSSHDLTR
jgi:acetolactate synthase-1/2/3 large subunit